MAILLTATAQGHGAPEPRSFESLILQDNTQAGDYGTINLEVQSIPNPAVANEAVDLLAVFAREAYGPSGDAGTWFRIIYQGGGEGTHRIDFGFDADSTYARFFESSNLQNWVGDADYITPEVIPVGDGHPRALEFFIAMDPATITNVAMESKLGGQSGDFAPGTYQTLLGVEALTPEDNSVSSDLSMDGPDELFVPTATPSGDTGFEFEIANQIDETQFITLNATGGFGISGVFSPSSVALGPGETATVSLSIDAVVSGFINVEMISDFGGRYNTALSFETETVPLQDTDGVFGIDDLIPPGAAYEFTFPEAGENGYHCHPHPFMTGTVIVQSGANPAGPTTHDVFIFDNGVASAPEEMGFRDAASGTSTTTIFEGDTVRWTNTGSHPDFHNVAPGGHDGHGHDHGDGHGSHGHGEPENESTPAPLGLIPLIGMALWRRK